MYFIVGHNVCNYYNCLNKLLTFGENFFYFGLNYAIELSTILLVTPILHFLIIFHFSTEYWIGFY